eukprot:2739496-Pleurochrysis_carterae.AAC.1
MLRRLRCRCRRGRPLRRRRSRPPLPTRRIGRSAASGAWRAAASSGRQWTAPPTAWPPSPPAGAGPGRHRRAPRGRCATRSPCPLRAPP